MRKFASGLLVGGLLMAGISFGTDMIQADDRIDYGNLTKEESDAMQLAWYQYHHDDLIKGLSGECE